MSGKTTGAKVGHPGHMAAGTAPAAAQTLTTRGVIAPRTEATLSAQISARIARLPIDHGQPVRAGDVLVEFDCALEQARMKAAQADLESTRAWLANLQRLDRMGSAGKLDVRVAPDGTLASANADTLDIPYLSMAHGGPIRTVPAKGGGGNARPSPSIARRWFPTDCRPKPPRPSPARWRAAVSTIIRESSF